MSKGIFCCLVTVFFLSSSLLIAKSSDRAQTGAARTVVGAPFAGVTKGSGQVSTYTKNSRNKSSRKLQSQTYLPSRSSLRKGGSFVSFNPRGKSSGPNTFKMPDWNFPSASNRSQESNNSSNGNSKRRFPHWEDISSPSNSSPESGGMSGAGDGSNGRGLQDGTGSANPRKMKHSGNANGRAPRNIAQNNNETPNYSRQPPFDGVLINPDEKVPEGIPDDVDISKFGPTVRKLLEEAGPDEDFVAYETIGGQTRKINLLADSDESTIAHELTHGVDFRKSSGSKRAFFNTETGEYDYLEEPPISYGQIADEIPDELKGMPGSNGGRFSTYLGNGRMANMPDNPLYVLEEWNAYVTGGKAGNEAIESGTWTGGRSDGVAGALEFAAYSAGLVSAIEKNGSGYLDSENGKQFMKYVRDLNTRSMKVFNEGKDNAYFSNDKQETYYKNFQDYLQNRASPRVRDLFLNGNHTDSQLAQK